MKRKPPPAPADEPSPETAAGRGIPAAITRPADPGRRAWLGRGLTAAWAGPLSLGLGAGGCAWLTPPPKAVDQPLTALPTALGRPVMAVPRELRGAWVASVDHIDWPSRPGLTSAQQRDEALRLMDLAAGLGLNALMLQVRPAADALYPSALEPWSEYLTGEQGRPPDGGWDPLAFWIDGAHRRGLELHAWFNPYRAHHPTAPGPLAESHIARRRPDLVRRYGDKLWMDPAEPEAAAHTLAVVADVLDRYDVDGVHIDDYFYPYPVRGEDGTEQPFPDDAPWARYQAGGGTASRADWRRAQVDALVQALHALVRSRRPDVRFGISPFGLPQPALRPPGIRGFSQYDKLYANVEHWLAEGWMDYCAPQLYWPLDQAPQAFAVLADAWSGLNPRGVAMWPGLFTSRVGAAERAWPAQEVVDQVEALRARPAIGGHIHFSAKALAEDRDGIATRLRQGAYAAPASVPVHPGAEPAGPWPVPRILVRRTGDGWALSLTAVSPPAGSAAGRVQVQPVAEAVGASATASAASAASTPSTPVPVVPTAPPSSQALAPVRQWAVWRRRGGSWTLQLQPGAQAHLDAEGAEALVVQAIVRGGQVGMPRAWWPGAPERDPA